ncbi:MAG: hypothetical protein AAF432_07965 [Planctomycetota bacterium]
MSRTHRFAPAICSSLAAAGLGAALLSGLTQPAQACVDPGPPPAVWVTFHPPDPNTPCPFDLDGDGFVGATDLAIIQGLVGLPCPACPADFNGNGVIDPGDVQILLDNFGDCVPVQCIWLTIHDYTSFGANPGQFCACALNVLSPFITVEDVLICDAATGLPIPGWDFVPNNVVGQEFNIANGGGNFVGFLSETTATIPPGFDIDIKFKVSAPVGVGFDEVRQALQSADNIVGTDEGNFDGTLTGGHFGLRPAGQIGGMPPPCPWDCTPVNADGTVGNGLVNIDDLLAVINSFGDPGGPCDVTPLNPDGTVGNGIINIDDLLSVINNFGPCPLEIFGIEPPVFQEGDIVKISGVGFGWDPDDLCVVLRTGDRAVPMRALSVTDAMICAQVGAIPPGAPAGQVEVMLGNGGQGMFNPIFPDIQVDVPVWVWEGDGGGGAGGDIPGQPDPTNPDPNQQWFFSNLVDGELCTVISGDWPEGAKIRITARAHTDSSQQDLDAPQVRFLDAGSVQECAERIKDVVVCAFQQQTGVIVEAECTDLGNGEVKITVRVPGEFINWGLFDICVTACPPDLQVTDFFPKTGQTGDIITICGTGFDPDPDNNCAVVMMGPNCSLPLQVINVSPDGTKMDVEVGPIWQGAQPGPIMVGLGQGGFDFFQPVFPEIIVPQPVWTWVRDVNGPMDDTTDLPGGTFNPVPPPTEQWIHGEPDPATGQLCLILPPGLNWAPNQKINMTLRMHDHAQGIGYDGYFPCVTLNVPAGGTPEQCAELLCDIARCAFLQNAGIAIECDIITLPDGSIKIVAGILNGNVDWGNFDVCLLPPEPPVVTIDGFTPTTGQTGDIITIFGSGFDPDPDNNCAVVMMGQFCSLPLQVIDVNPAGTQMQVEVGAIWQGAQPGPIMVGLGQGDFGTFQPAFPEIIVEQPVWIWDRDVNGPMDDTTDLPGGGNFDPVPPPAEQWIHGEPDPASGLLCVVIPPGTNWEPFQKLQITLRMHDHAQGIGHDGYFPCIRLDVPPPGGDPLFCAELICDTVRCAFFQQSGIIIDCFVKPLPDGGVKITASIPGGFVNWGNFDICLIPGT